MAREIVIKMAQIKQSRKNRKCNQQTYNPFWKKPSDVRNRVETRAQLKIKTKASRKFQRRYQKWIDSLTSEDWDFTSDWDRQYNFRRLGFYFRLGIRLRLRILRYRYIIS